MCVGSTGHVFKDVADRFDDRWRDVKTDLAMYRTLAENGDKAPGCSAWELGADRAQKSRVHSARKEHLARTIWAWIVCCLEIKRYPSQDPFDDQNLSRPIPDSGAAPHLRDNPNAERARTQLAQYAAEVFARQHRVFVYTPIIIGKYARLIRWDRSGAVVSEAFNYIKNPAPLFNFFYRLARASPRDQGYDTSVSLADAAQIAELECYAKSLNEPPRSTEPGVEHKRRFLATMMADRDRHPLRQVRTSIHKAIMGWILSKTS